MDAHLSQLNEHAALEEFVCEIECADVPANMQLPVRQAIRNAIKQNRDPYVAAQKAKKNVRYFIDGEME